MKNLVIGIAFDAFDWLIAGFIPVLGDLVDVFAAWFWYRKIGPAGASALIEIIPAADILPINIICGYLADRKEGKGGKK